MKTSFFAGLTIFLFSFCAISAEVITCHFPSGAQVSNVVVLNEKVLEEIQSILNSSKTLSLKTQEIKKSLAGDAELCAIAPAIYNVSLEKCLRTLHSNDIVAAIYDDSIDVKDIPLACKIGVTAKLLMQFNM